MAANKFAHLFHARQLLTKISRTHNYIHVVFRWKSCHCCCANEPSEWSWSCCVI